MCAFEFTASNKVTKPLQSLLLSQTSTFSSDIRGEQLLIKNELYHMKFSMTSSNKASLLEGATTSLKRSIELASENGASNWLSVLPLQEYNFSLHKTAFHDAVALRYGWDPARLPQHCACGTKFTVEHSFTCPKGGFPSIHHNEIHDLTASLLTKVCHEVDVEPHLQPITGEQFTLASSNIEDGARLDISAMVFGVAVVRKLTLMLKSLITHTLLVIVPPVPVPFTENMNCVRNVHMKLAYVRLNRVPLLL